jgi:hypothetical protein
LEDDRRSPERNGDNPVGMVAMADVISQAESCDSNCNQLWRVHSALYTIAAADGQRVVHIGRDESLREKLVAEINQRNLDAESLNGTGPSVLHEFTITWNIIRLENSVTVQADLSADGTTKRFTFSSDGICLDHACEKAVKNAVTVVYAIMRDQSHPWAEKLT